MESKYPPVKGYVRGVVFFTAYLIREADVGCKLPAWLINRLTRVIGPRMLKKLHKACLKYPAWKASNQPAWKPWIYPEQQASTIRWAHHSSLFPVLKLQPLSF
uniref:START domain-containing protein n=1 Tax=Parascaris equorum TaxID=6256 RepID=A0A914S478_PAREQ